MSEPLSILQLAHTNERFESMGPIFDGSHAHDRKRPRAHAWAIDRTADAVERAKKYANSGLAEKIHILLGWV